MRRNSRTSILTSAFEEELTLHEFLSRPEMMTYDDVMFGSGSETQSVNTRSDTNSDQFEMVSLTEFLSGNSSFDHLSSPDPDSSRTSSCNSENLPKKRVHTPSTKSNDTTGSMDRSLTGSRRSSRDSGIKCSRENLHRSSKRPIKENKQKAKLETIVSPSVVPDDDLFSFYDLLARPELCSFDEVKVKEHTNILEALIRPLMSPRNKPRPSLSTSNKSLESTGKVGKSSSSLCSSESLNLAASETSQESGVVDPAMEEEFDLMEFLKHPPPTDLLNRTSSLLSLARSDSKPSLYHQDSSSDTIMPLYRSRAKSEEDMVVNMRDYSLVEFLSAQHLNPPIPIKSGGLFDFGSFNLAKSIRQLSQGAIWMDKDLTLTELLALRRVSSNYIFLGSYHPG